MQPLIMLLVSYHICIYAYDTHVCTFKRSSNRTFRFFMFPTPLHISPYCPINFVLQTYSSSLHLHFNSYYYAVVVRKKVHAKMSRFNVTTITVQLTFTKCIYHGNQSIVIARWSKLLPLRSRDCGPSSLTVEGINVHSK